ncbi:GOLPH3/VPS74 family protein [Luteococcus peritonei]|uniref:GPP34 family phosphoprotein n=1 Tax=Luteococcus peritonei TaxID=88874 RepID=A0ABW4RSK2_9ACTN
MLLALPHHLALLSLDPESGGRRSTIPTSYAIATLALAELVLRGRLDVVHGKVAVSHPEPTGEPLLDEALAGVQNDTLRAPVARINRLRAQLEQSCFRQLVSGGVLRARTEGSVARTVLAIADPVPVAALRQKLRTGMGLAREDICLVLGLRIASLEQPVLGEEYRTLRAHAEELVEMGELPAGAAVVLRAGHEARATMAAGLVAEG